MGGRPDPLKRFKIAEATQPRVHILVGTQIPNDD